MTMSRYMDVDIDVDIDLDMDAGMDVDMDAPSLSRNLLKGVFLITADSPARVQDLSLLLILSSLFQSRLRESDARQ